LGRWLSVDPLADKYFGWSPYNYVKNNPLIFVDHNGMYTTSYIDEEGNEIVPETKDGNNATVIIPNSKKKEFIDEYNNTSVLFRDGVATNSEWIQKYGAMM